MDDLMVNYVMQVLATLSTMRRANGLAAMCVDRYVDRLAQAQGNELIMSLFCFGTPWDNKIQV